jgi:hypothetical protein
MKMTRFWLENININWIQIVYSKANQQFQT